jgi:hypothetical protein
VNAKEYNLPEALVEVIGETVNLHPIVPGEDVAGCLAELEQVLRNDPDQQTAGLQPGTTADEPLVFKAAVFIVVVVGWIKLKEVVAAARGDEIQVAIVQDARSMLVNSRARFQQPIHRLSRCGRPAIMQFHAKGIQSLC